MKEQSILNIEDLTVYYETEDMTVKAVSDLSLEMKKGETIGLVGETGAGKTTVALAILNLLPNPPAVIKKGSICLNGHNVLNMDARQLANIRGKEVAMIFQDPMTSLNPVFTVGEQIAESIYLHENISRQEAMERAGDMLELVGIQRERKDEYPHQFSGGMKQRVVIAIALSCNPSLLIADEPTTALDVTIQEQVLELMRELRDKYGTSMIMITHDLGIVAETCDQVAVMYAGRIVEKGTLEDIFLHTCHPYTEGLFDAIPTIGHKKSRLQSIPGLMPDPSDLPVGCAFAPRCRYASEKCLTQLPSSLHVSESHYVACCRYEEEDFAIRRNRKDGN